MRYNFEESKTGLDASHDEFWSSDVDENTKAFNTKHEVITRSNSRQQHTPLQPCRLWSTKCIVLHPCLPVKDHHNSAQRSPQPRTKITTTPHKDHHNPAQRSPQPRTKITTTLHKDHHNTDIVLPFPRKHQRTPHRAIGCLHYGHSCLGAHGKRSASNEQEWTANLLAYLGLTDQAQEDRVEPMANVRAPQPRPLRPMSDVSESEGWPKPSDDVSSEAPKTRNSIHGLSMRPILLRNLATTELHGDNVDFPKDKPIVDADFENYDEIQDNYPKTLRRFARSVNFTGTQVKGAVKKMKRPVEEDNKHDKNIIHSISFQNSVNTFHEKSGINNEMNFLKRSTNLKTVQDPKEYSRPAEKRNKPEYLGSQDKEPVSVHSNSIDSNSNNSRYRRRTMVLHSGFGSQFFNIKKTEGTGSA
ncbi:hypothetical protein FHG87_005524 [Trinorchestia longiramus]|nr:hypothetical protein FHG87_005524 [Trinorchestia longiramus]